MSQKLMDSLEQARKELLEAQRKCAWCEQVFPTAGTLAIHIVEAGHSKLPEGTSFEAFKAHCEQKDAQ